KPVTDRLVPAASSMFPAAVNVSASAVSVPVSIVAESSLIDTAPDDVNVSVPKFKTSAGLSPSGMDVPASDALPLTDSALPLASVRAPAEVRVNVPAVLVPLSVVAEPSLMLTAPVELKVRLPKFSVAPAPSVIDVPLNDALLVTVRLAPGAS